MQAETFRSSRPEPEAELTAFDENSEAERHTGHQSPVWTVAQNVSISAVSLIDRRSARARADHEAAARGIHDAAR